MKKKRIHRVPGDHRKQLSNAAVVRLRRRYSRGEVSTTELAREYRVDPSTISRIMRGDSRRKQAGPRSGGLVTAAGERNGRHKLTNGLVKRIRARYERGKVTQRVLAETNGVSSVCVCLLVNRKTWRHLP